MAVVGPKQAGGAEGSLPALKAWRWLWP